jgi:NhaP-type Na+/H+ or K+/H+ antiporter
VFGESVFNDAVAIVLFRTFASFESRPATLLAALRGVGTFMTTFVLSTVIGTVIGSLSALLFKHVRMSKADAGLEVERAILVTAPLISYMFAEGVQTSGVVAVLFTGIIMGRFTAKVRVS